MSSDAALAIWTTTPWTIPANAAVAVNDALVYAVVQVSDPAEGASKFLVVAKDLVGSLASTMGKELTVVAEMSGAALEGTTYRCAQRAVVNNIVISCAALVCKPFC